MIEVFYVYVDALRLRSTMGCTNWEQRCLDATFLLQLGTTELRPEAVSCTLVDCRDQIQVLTWTDECID